MGLHWQKYYIGILPMCEHCHQRELWLKAAISLKYNGVALAKILYWNIANACGCADKNIILGYCRYVILIYILYILDMMVDDSKNQHFANWLMWIRCCGS
jgi:hypothetical protein